MNIHPTAIVSKKAEISEDVEIGPYTLIEDDVKIGQRVKIYSHVHILEHTSIDDDCQIHMGAVLGHLPQMRKNINSGGRLIIGKRNILREYTSVHRSSQDGNATVINDDNYLMAFSHIAHDCHIGNHVTICNGTLIAGHVRIFDYVFISGNVTVHQFCRIGKWAMIGGLARVAKDVPPYMLVKGDSAVWAINSTGLKRGNFSVSARSQIKEAFKILYRSGLNVTQAIERLQRKPTCSEVEHLIDFIQHSQRGICGYKNPTLWEKICLNNPVTRCKPVLAYQLFLKQNKKFFKNE